MKQGVSVVSSVKLSCTNGREALTTVKRPMGLSGWTFKFRTDSGNLFVTVNTNGDGQTPAEVFLQVGKAGTSMNAMAEALGRVISVALQHGVPVAEIIHQLQHIKSAPTRQDNGEIVGSIPDAVALALEHVTGLNRLNPTETLNAIAADKGQARGLREDTVKPQRRCR